MEPPDPAQFENFVRRGSSANLHGNNWKFVTSCHSLSHRRRESSFGSFGCSLVISRSFLGRWDDGDIGVALCTFPKCPRKGLYSLPFTFQLSDAVTLREVKTPCVHTTHTPMHSRATPTHTPSANVFPARVKWANNWILLVALNPFSKRAI